MLAFYFLFLTAVTGQDILPIPVDPNDCLLCSPLFCFEEIAVETCEFGTTLNPFCTCCEICLKGPGESCGGFSSEECAEGLICLEIDSEFLDLSICVLPINESIVPGDCEACSEYYGCLNETCELGSLPHPYCDCCSICLKDEGESCEKHPYLPDGCAEGLTCVVLDIFSLIGTCTNTSGPCDCPPELCPEETCLFGTFPNFQCECCDVCLRGPGESCGGFTLLPGICADGLTCVGEDLAVDVPGTCVECDNVPVWPPFFPPGNPFPFPGKGKGKGRGRGHKFPKCPEYILD